LTVLRAFLGIHLVHTSVYISVSCLSSKSGPRFIKPVPALVSRRRLDRISLGRIYSETRMNGRFHYIIHLIIVLAHVANFYVAYKIYMQNKTYLFERRSGKGWNYFVMALFVLVSCLHVCLRIIEFVNDKLKHSRYDKERMKQFGRQFRAFSISLFFISFIQYVCEIYIYIFKSTTLVEQSTAYWVMIQLLLSFVLASFTLQLFIYEGDEVDKHQMEEIRNTGGKQGTNKSLRRGRTDSSSSDVSSDDTLG
jgi:hypothetical protein